MDLYFNINGGAISLDQFSQEHTTEAIPVPAGQEVAIRLQSHRDGVPELLPSGSSLLIGLKEDADFEGGYLSSSATWTVPGAPTGFYETVLLLGSDPILALFEPTTERVKNNILEFYFWPVENELPTRSLKLKITLENYLNRGGEQEADATTPYPPADRLLEVNPLTGEILGPVTAEEFKEANDLGGSDSTSLEFAVQDYGAAAADWIDDAILGKTAGTGTYNIFSAGNYTTGTGFVRNTNLWADSLDLTCFSPWNSAQGQCQGGVLITSKHVLLAYHFSGVGGQAMVAGSTTIKFVAADNTILTRTVSALTRVGVTDHLIGTLDSDLPSTIKPARIFPEVTAGIFPAGTPLIYSNQNKEARIGEFGVSSSTTVNFVSAEATNRTSWTVSPVPLVAGDSGSAIWMIVNNEPALIALASQVNGGVTVYGYKTEINAVLGGGYALDMIPVNAATDLLAGHLASNNTWTGTNAFAAVTATSVGATTVTGASGTIGGAILAGYSPPSIIGVGNIGTPGSTTYTYVAVAKDAFGNTTTGSTPVSTTTGNATLSGGNYNIIGISSPFTAASYDIYRTVGGATMGKIGNLLTVDSFLSDTGLTGDGNPPPTVNTTSTINGNQVPTGSSVLVLRSVAATYQSASVSTAGNTDSTSASLRHSFKVTAAAGAGTYTRTITLPVGSHVAGDIQIIHILYAASVNPTVTIKNATSGGTTLFTWTGDGTVTEIHSTFVFNGAAWEREDAHFIPL